MPATLDLVGHDGGDDDFGIYRDDEYVLRLPFVRQSGGEPMSEIAGYEFTAHVRRERVGAGASAGDPLAEFDVDMSEADDGVVTLSLTRDQTAGLPSVGVWDLQVDDVTWLTGQVSVRGDVTRPAAS